MKSSNVQLATVSALFSTVTLLKTAQIFLMRRTVAQTAPSSLGSAVGATLSVSQFSGT